jgi:hypothetical protein
MADQTCDGSTRWGPLGLVPLGAPSAVPWNLSSIATRLSSDRAGRRGSAPSVGHNLGPRGLYVARMSLSGLVVVVVDVQQQLAGLHDPAR